MPTISQTMFNALLERVCNPIPYLSRRIDSATPLWDGPIKMCQKIENDLFAVDTVVRDAKIFNNNFNGINTPLLYNAILCRVYIILYYCHRDDQLYQEIVFPRLKENMGDFNEKHITTINEQIDKILAQEELIKRIQAEKRKGIKPVFAYVRPNENEQDHLYIEYSEELLFRNMKDFIKHLTNKYDTHQDEATVWYNAKEVVHTLRDVNRPELLIERAAKALAAGQVYHEYEGSQIILICAYAMIRSSKDNTHFAPFIKEMESLADANTDLFVIKYSINAIKDFIDKNHPFDDYDYIGEETSNSKSYTNADIERIKNQIVEHEKAEREKLLKKVEGLGSNEKVLKQRLLSLEKELEIERTKKKSEPTDEEQETIMSLKNDLAAFKIREKDGREVVMFSAKQMAIIVKAVLLNHKSLTNNTKNLAPLLQRFGGWKENYAISALSHAVTQKECDELEEIFKPFAPAIGSIIKQYPTVFAEEKKAKLENNLGKKVK